MAIGQQAPLHSRVDWIDASRIPARILSNRTNGIFSPTPVPSGDSVGGSAVAGSGFQHVTITVGAAGMVQQIHHKLGYTPLAAFAIQQLAEGTTPAGFYAVTGATDTYVSMVFSSTGVWDLYWS